MNTHSYEIVGVKCGEIERERESNGKRGSGETMVFGLKISLLFCLLAE
jgi:hypothetical protein